MEKEQVLSALDLFKRYHNRYPGIRMAPLHLGGITEAGRLYLMPMRGDTPLVDKQLLAARKYPYVDIFRARIRVRTDFKPEHGKSPQTQQEEALWKKLSGEYFARRRFTMHVGTLPGYYDLSLREYPMFPVRFKVWRRMRGLVLEPGDTEPVLYAHWSAFVPRGTRAHDAIQAALDVAHVANKKPIRTPQAEIDKFKAIQREKVALADA